MAEGGEPWQTYLEKYFRLQFNPGQIAQGREAGGVASSHIHPKRVPLACKQTISPSLQALATPGSVG